MNRFAVRKTLFLLSAALVVASFGQFDGAAVRAQSKTVVVNGHEAVAGEVLVKFRTPPRPGDIEQAADADQVEAVGSHGLRRVHSRTLDVAGLVRSLAHRADVAYAEPNYILRADRTPADTYVPLLWGLINNGQAIVSQTGTPGADISADAAWDITTGSRDNVVGVVDTGVDYTHPDLAGNIWSAPSSFTVTIGGSSITCAAGTHGFNAITRTCNPMDDNNHGTHVSGTIGAVGDNGIGVAGVNWVASVMGLKFLDSQGNGSTSGAIDAIDFAIQAKRQFGARANVRVLSNSWGGDASSQALLEEINAAAASEMLFVAAAGNNSRNNDATPSYPASYQASNIIAVAATDNRDALASFSNYGATSVELAAPGVYIVSTTRAGGYAYMSGTSMATPHVSGAAALTLAACPSLTTLQLVSTILAAVDQVPSLAGKTSTGGRLNAFRAVSSCGAPAAAPSPDFTLAVSPASRSVTAGGGTSFTTGLTRLNGYTANPALSIVGLPQGVAATFGTNPLVTSSTLNVTTSGNTPAGTYTLAITASDGKLSHTASVALIVTAPVSGDFSLSASPSSISIRRGVSGSTSISVTRAGGFASDVQLTLAGAPAGVKPSFSTNPVTTSSGSSTLTLVVSSGTRKGTTTLTVTGTSGGLSHSATVQLQVR